MVDFLIVPHIIRDRQRKHSGAENFRYALYLRFCFSPFNCFLFGDSNSFKRLFYLLAISKLFSSLNFPTAHRINPARLFPLDFITASIPASSVGLNFVVQVVRSPLCASLYFLSAAFCASLRAITQPSSTSSLIPQSDKAATASASSLRACVSSSNLIIAETRLSGGGIFSNLLRCLVCS